MRAYCDASFDEKKGIAGIGITIINGQKRRTDLLAMEGRAKYYER